MKTLKERMTEEVTRTVRYIMEMEKGLKYKCECILDSIINYGIGKQTFEKMLSLIDDYKLDAVSTGCIYCETLSRYTAYVIATNTI